MHQRRTEFPPVGCCSQLFNRLILLALLGIAMAESSPPTAQTTSTLRGAITDQQYLAVVGARITLSAPTGIDAECRSVATSRLLVQSVPVSRDPVTILGGAANRPRRRLLLPMADQS